MSMITLKCPKCDAEAKLSLADNDYSGPRRCWKCHEFFTITIHNGKVISCEPLSKEEYDRQQEEIKAREKAKGGKGFSSQAQMSFPEEQKDGKSPSDYEKIDIFNIIAGKSAKGKETPNQDQPVSQETPPANAVPSNYDDGDIFKHLGKKSGENKEPPKQQNPAFPAKAAEKPRQYIPPAPPKDAPKQAGPEKTGDVFPPNRFQTFIPVEKPEDKPEKTPDKKPQKPKNPPDRFNTFIPPQT